MYLYNQAEMTDDVLRMLDFEIFIQVLLMWNFTKGMRVFNNPSLTSDR